MNALRACFVQTIFFILGGERVEQGNFGHSPRQGKNYLVTFLDNIYCVSDWKAVDRGVNIPWDLEATPLQIKTDSLPDSERIWVNVNDAVNINVRRVMVTFSNNTYKYGIYNCNNKEFPVQPQEGVEKIWTIAKTESELIITRNGVKVLNYVFADAPYSTAVACPQWWGGDIVEQISFNEYDTASDFYRSPGIRSCKEAYCPNFILSLNFLVDDC